MPKVSKIKILVADHHVVVGAGIAAILRSYSDFDVLGHAKSGEELLQFLKRHTLDIIAIDLDLPCQSCAIEMIRSVRDKSPQTRILVITNLLEEVMIHNAIRAGVTGYMLKTASARELASAIRSTYQGVATWSPQVTQVVMQEPSTLLHDGNDLTAREYQVLELIAQGRNNTQIANELGVSVSTVQFHVSNVLSKLGVQNRVEATAYAIRHKLSD